MSLSDDQGFTFKVASQYSPGSDGDYRTVYLYWKRATGAGTTPPTIAAVSGYAVATAIVYRGCTANGDPFDATASVYYTGGETTSVQDSGLTTSSNNTLVSTLAIFDQQDDGSANSCTWGDTEIYDQSVQFSVGGGGGAPSYQTGGTFRRGFTAQTVTKATAGFLAGATGTLAGQCINDAITFALKP